MKKIIDIPRPQTWDGWITEWGKRTHLADLLILLDEGPDCAKTAYSIQKYFELLLGLAEGNSVGLYNDASPRTALANRAFGILNKELFSTTHDVQLLFFRPQVIAGIIHFFRPANGKTRLIGLQNVSTAQETRAAKKFAEDICLFILNGLDDQMKKSGNAATVSIILENRIWAIQVLHALGRLGRLVPSKSTDWNKFDSEVMATLKKLAKKDLGNEATDLKGEEMVKFARSIGSQAAILYLAVRSHEEYASEH